MADEDTPVVIAADLTSWEAGMMRGLLESAGIGAIVIDRINRTALVEPGMGGARLAVLAADARRAIEIARSAGVFPGRASDEPVEIPEEEWSRPAAAESAGGPGSSARSEPDWPRWLVLAAAIAAVAWLLG